VIVMTRSKIKIASVPIIDLFLSLISVWWAIILFNNEDMLNHVPRKFETLAQIQETGWALVFTTAAFIKVLGIILEQKALRRIGLYFSAFLYGMICAGYILSPAAFSTSTGVYFALSVLAIWGIREVKTNA
jgi:hypothetical protein